jgi:hypothetical protein
MLGIELEDIDARVFELERRVQESNPQALDPR